MTCDHSAIFSAMNMPNVLIALKSCHRHADRRAAQQATWLRDVDFADWTYIVGKPTAPLLPNCILAETSDDFKDIAPKIWVACRYALEQNKEFLFIGDDDTFAVPQRLATSGFQKHDYVGFMRTSGLFYNNEIPYAQGSAFWLSARAMEFIVTDNHMLPGIPDDCAVGRALIDKVAFTHDWRYEPGPEPVRRPLPGNNVITTHKALPQTMRNLYAEWRNTPRG